MTGVTVCQYIKVAVDHSGTYFVTVNAVITFTVCVIMCGITCISARNSMS